MGYSPQQVDAMSYWQFIACSDGYAKVHGTKEHVDPPSDDEFLAWADEVRGNA